MSEQQQSWAEKRPCPFGLRPKTRHAALLVVHLGTLNLTSFLAPCLTGFGAATLRLAQCEQALATGHQQVAVAASDCGGGAQLVGLVGHFPAETCVFAAKVAIGGGLAVLDLIDVEQVEHAQDSIRAEIEVVAN